MAVKVITLTLSPDTLTSITLMTRQTVKVEDVEILAKKGYDKFKYVSDYFVMRNGGVREECEDEEEDHEEDDDDDDTVIRGETKYKDIQKLRRKLMLAEDEEDIDRGEREEKWVRSTCLDYTSNLHLHVCMCVVVCRDEKQVDYCIQPTNLTRIYIHFSPSSPAPLLCLTLLPILFPATLTGTSRCVPAPQTAACR